MKRNTKQNIIDAASDLMWQSHYHDVSVDEICKLADVRKGSFYYYFASKLELSLSLLDEMEARFDEIIGNIFTPLADIGDAFDEYVRVMVDFQHEAFKTYGHVCGCPQTSLVSDLVKENEVLCKRTIELIENKIQFYQNKIEQYAEQNGLEFDNPADKAKRIFNYITGELSVAKMLNSLDGMEQSIKSFIQRELSTDVQSLSPSETAQVDENETVA